MATVTITKITESCTIKNGKIVKDSHKDTLRKLCDSIELSLKAALIEKENLKKEEEDILQKYIVLRDALEFEKYVAAYFTTEENIKANNENETLQKQLLEKYTKYSKDLKANEEMIKCLKMQRNETLKLINEL